MKYNPYYDQAEFQQHKYADQPTLHLLDWELERLVERQRQLSPADSRKYLHQILLAQIEADLQDLKTTLSIDHVDTVNGLMRYELTLDLGGVIESRATLLWPISSPHPTPVFICLHGHQHEGRQWTVNNGPAAVLSKAGYVCFCPDVLGLGENRGETENVIRGNISYDLVVHNALLLGWNLNGLRIWVLERWLQALTDCDCFMGGAIHQFACAGFSLGGELALFMSALHTEIEPIYISGYACSWKASYWSKLHCKCAYVPGLARLLDTLDVYRLLLPRPLVVEAGCQDQSFPWTDTQPLLEQIGREYKDAAAEDFFSWVKQDSDHVFDCTPQTLNFLQWMIHGKGR
jgi:hypothetical protein